MYHCSTCLQDAEALPWNLLKSFMNCFSRSEAAVISVMPIEVSTKMLKKTPVYDRSNVGLLVSVRKKIWRIIKK
jgi:hypothetical protein